jgi:hypothetical protein
MHRELSFDTLNTFELTIRAYSLLYTSQLLPLRKLHFEYIKIETGDRFPYIFRSNFNLGKPGTDANWISRGFLSYPPNVTKCAQQ